MPVRRDPRTQRWFFRSIVRLPDGRKVRIFGTPGIPGAYQDFINSKAGAIQAENRAKAQALHGTTATADAPEPTTKERARAAAPAATEAEAPTKRTVRECAPEFLANYKPEQKPSERRTKTRILSFRLLPFFGDMPVDGIKQTDVDRFAKKELADGLTVKTVNNRLAVLSTLLRYATGEKPKLRLNLSGMAGEMNAVVTADVEKLIAAAGEGIERVIVLLAAEAGLRAGEIRGLQWGDARDGVLTIRRALDNVANVVIAPKHKARTVPISPRLRAALDALPRRGLWVVARPEGDALGYDTLLETISGLYRRAGVKQPRMAIHCLRHSFGTEMAKQVPLPVLQRLMGHSDLKTTLRYVDVDESQKRDAIATVFGRRGSQVAASTAEAT
jgi:integrase